MNMRVDLSSASLSHGGMTSVGSVQGSKGLKSAGQSGAGRFDNTCANRLMVVEAIKGRG
jgi:hypothetical protein